MISPCRVFFFFTFFDGSHAAACSRLDKFLILDGLGIWFSSIIQKAIPHILSDPFPIFVSLGDLSSSNHPFRFSMFGVRTRVCTTWWRIPSLKITRIMVIFGIG